MKPERIVQIVAADWRSEFHFFAVDDLGQVWGFIKGIWKCLNEAKLKGSS